MESFDSLWFFNNVLTLTNKGHPAAAIDEDMVKEEEQSKDKTDQTASQQNQNNEGLGTEILVPRCPKCGEIAGGIEQKMVQQVEVLECANSTEKPERRRKRRRKRSKRKVLGELDFGFYRSNLATDSCFSEETYGYPNFESQHYTKMPPLNDGLAMKQHLKSWAHAVACTVK